MVPALASAEFEALHELSIITTPMANHRSFIPVTSFIINTPLPDLGLTTLVLKDLPVNPDWSDYISIVLAAPSIRRLCLHNFGCNTFPSDDCVFLHFPDLGELDLRFVLASPSTSRLLRHLDVPSLKTIRFHGDTPADLICLAFCSNILPSVENLILSGHRTDSFVFHFLFINIPSLQTLEILGRRTLAEPGLVLNSILEADVRLKQAFLELGDPARHVSEIVFRGGIVQGQSNEEDMHWLKIRLDVMVDDLYDKKTWITGPGFYKMYSKYSPNCVLSGSSLWIMLGTPSIIDCQQKFLTGTLVILVRHSGHSVPNRKHGCMIFGQIAIPSGWRRALHAWRQIFEYILVIDWSKNPHPNQPTTGSCSFLVGPNVNLEPSDPTGGQEITNRGVWHIRTLASQHVDPRPKWFNVRQTTDLVPLGGLGKSDPL
ncbi:hypothetical protein B0H17DRAFT_1152030 [Mycena rosella]|uniref:F-box domain-containing protein n=1 Tax=Mycena rosella TaxID=1033263 RepID=A0AAD7BH15_MYCRO|nr:hypothetical protein B0H17DRAFT_1152030 [Mycena rosella]